MITFEAQLVRKGDVIQEFTVKTFDCAEQAEERAMQCVRNFLHLRSMTNFEDHSVLIIDFFEKGTEELAIRRIFRGEPNDLFSILNAVMKYRAYLKTQKPS